MLDTIIAHSAKTLKKTADDQKEQTRLYEILKFGTKKLFENQNEEGSKGDYEIQADQLKDLLDREAHFKKLEQDEAEQGESDGIKDYLSAFKVAQIERPAQVIEEGVEREQLDTLSIDYLERQREEDEEFQR